MLNVLGYTRVSQVGGRRGPSFRSPGQQEADIRAWAERNGARVVEVLEELNRSGGDGDRPVWNDVLRRAEAGEVDAVVVYDISRFSRDVADGAAAMQRLATAGVRFVALEDKIDIGGREAAAPMVQFQADVMLAFAALERRSKAERLARSRAEAKAEGVWCSEVPLGYRRDEHRRLVVHEPDAERVRQIFTLAAAGEPWRAIARQVGRSSAGCHRIVRNPVYKGAVPGAPRIVGDDVWAAAQPGPVKPGMRSGMVTSTGVLRGLVRCGSCHRRMAIRRTNYCCANECCPDRMSASVNLLDEHVQMAFADALGSDTPLGAMMRERKAHGGALAAQRRVIAEERAELERYHGLRGCTDAGIEQREAAVAAAEAELDRLLAIGAADTPDVSPLVSPEMADLAERRRDMARVVESVTITARATRAERGRWSPLPERVAVAWRGDPGEEALEAAAA